MRVLFAGAFRGEDKFHLLYEKIYKYIEELGYTHLDKEIIELTYKDFVRKMSSDKINKKRYLQKISLLKKADICVFETSNHSLGIGFLIEKALAYSKPVIVLYYKSNIPHFISGVDNEKLIVKSYSEINLNKVLETALDTASDCRDKRFNFFIRPTLLNYLEKASKEEDVTKSTFIRNLILEHMHRNIH